MFSPKGTYQMVRCIYLHINLYFEPFHLFRTVHVLSSASRFLSTTPILAVHWKLIIILSGLTEEKSLTFRLLIHSRTKITCNRAILLYIFTWALNSSGFWRFDLLELQRTNWSPWRGYCAKLKISQRYILHLYQNDNNFRAYSELCWFLRYNSG